MIRIQRRGLDDCPTTWRQTDTGAWLRQPTSRFALLDAVSAAGTPCAPSTRQWSAARQTLVRLIDAGQITD